MKSPQRTEPRSWLLGICFWGEELEGRRWRGRKGVAFDQLAPGGRLVVDVPAPDFATLADSFATPPRQPLVLDGDFKNGSSERLVRQRSESYNAAEQSQDIHYFYDLFDGQRPAERVVSRYTGHVYYPRELALLLRHTNFEVESMWGDHRRSELSHHSRVIIAVGRRPR